MQRREANFRYFLVLVIRDFLEKGESHPPARRSSVGVWYSTRRTNSAQACRIWQPGAQRPAPSRTIRASRVLSGSPCIYVGSPSRRPHKRVRHYLKNLNNPDNSLPDEECGSTLLDDSTAQLRVSRQHALGVPLSTRAALRNSKSDSHHRRQRVRDLYGAGQYR